MKTKFLFTGIGIYLIFSSCAGQNTSSLIRKNENIAKSFIEYLNAHDVDKFITLFAENCVYEEIASGRSYKTREKIAIYIRSTLSGIPDTKFETVNILAKDSLAVVEWIWKGTNSVGWTDMGLPATNKYFELRGLTIMVIKNGLITRNSDYWDWNSFLIGIGAKQ
ncbi:MAG: nuclear transport factor 2 family protein [Bacteroidales bacterium]|nr:nuclear transport factor 2 family protein [Bacteroidales bacterium]